MYSSNLTAGLLKIAGGLISGVLNLGTGSRTSAGFMNIGTDSGAYYESY